ncbi:unnamed protein product [Macrosiphum euphorbiae]|nr:unnamed protein product [Macrosiphum euphorbiae]
MTRKIKKIKAVSNNENPNKTVVQKTKKSNSRAKRLKDVTNNTNKNIMKAVISEKNAGKNKSESRKSKNINKTETLSKSSSNTNMASVAYEEIILEQPSTLPDIDDNGTILTECAKLEKFQLNTKCFLKLEDIMKSQNTTVKTKKQEMKQCTKTTTESSSNLPDQNERLPVISASFRGSGRRKSIRLSNRRQTDPVGYKEEPAEPGTSETIIENSSTLPDTDDNEGSVHKKPKTKQVTFEKNRHKKRFTSNKHLKDKSNSNNIKEKNAIENDSESRKRKNINKTDTLSKSSSNTESVGYEDKQLTAEIIEENSLYIPYEDDNETAYFKDPGRRKSRFFNKPTEMDSVEYKEEQCTAEIIEENSSNLPDKDDNEIASLECPERRKSRWLINPIKIESVGYEVEPKVPEGTSGTVLEKSSTLSDIDDSETILTESAKLEIVQNMKFSGNLEKLEDTTRSQITTIKIEYHEIKQCFETATECSSNLSDTDDNEVLLTESSKLEMECLTKSNSKLKRKLSNVKVIVEELQDRLKRFKSS